MKSKDIATSHIFLFDGKGGGKEAAKITQPLKKGQFMWHNLDYQDDKTLEILADNHVVDPEVIKILVEEDTRPRYFAYKDGFMLTMRVVNDNEGHKLHDMISLRIWIDNEKIITLSHRNIRSLKNIFTRFKSGNCPKTTTECLIEIADEVLDDIANAIYDIGIKTDKLEEDVINAEKVRNPHLRTIISAYRHKILVMRRFLFPQKDIFIGLQSDKSDFFSKKERLRLREIYDKNAKAIEDLDYIHDHLMVSFEELQSKVNVKISKIMYVISIVTMIFLPLNFFTSLLGINMKGIPFAESSYAFGAVSFILLIIGIMLTLFFRRIKWI